MSSPSRVWGLPQWGLGQALAEIEFGAFQRCFLNSILSMVRFDYSFFNVTVDQRRCSNSHDVEYETVHSICVYWHVYVPCTDGIEKFSSADFKMVEVLMFPIETTGLVTCTAANSLSDNCEFAFLKTHCTVKISASPAIHPAVSYSRAYKNLS